MATTHNQAAMTLYELNGMVRSTIESVLADEYWVEAELSEVRESRGHCYMELIEKDANAGDRRGPCCALTSSAPPDNSCTPG